MTSKSKNSLKELLAGSRKKQPVDYALEKMTEVSSVPMSVETDQYKMRQVSDEPMKPDVTVTEVSNEPMSGLDGEDSPEYQGRMLKKRALAVLSKKKK